LEKTSNHEGKQSHAQSDCVRQDSYYHRRISDLPTGGKQVIVQLRVGKYFCANSDCKRQIFTERFTTGLASF
jgi:transposase